MIPELFNVFLLFHEILFGGHMGNKKKVPSCLLKENKTCYIS